MASFCPRRANQVWRPHAEYAVFNSSVDLDFVNRDSSVEDLECARGLHLSFQELRLARLESRPVGPQAEGEEDHGRKKKRRGRKRTELLLGDIHTSAKKRMHYRPTAMQPYGLVRASKVRKM